MEHGRWRGGEGGEMAGGGAELLSWQSDLSTDISTQTLANDPSGRRDTYGIMSYP